MPGIALPNLLRPGCVFVKSWTGWAPPRVFHAFVLSGNEDALEAFYTVGRQVPVLGTDRFGAWVRKKVRVLSPEHPRYERMKVRPSIHQVFKRVATVFQVKVATLTTSRRGETNDARKVAMYVVKWLCDLTLSETAREFGVTSYGAVGWACAQVRAKQDTEPQFKKRVEEVEMSISQQKC